MANTEKILRKRKPTGVELGQVDLSLTARDFAAQYLDSETEAPPQSQWDTLQRRINNLPPDQTQIYLRYIDIHKWIDRNSILADLTAERALTQVKDLSFLAFNIYTSEEVNRYIESLHLESAPGMPFSVCRYLSEFSPESLVAETHRHEMDRLRQDFEIYLQSSLAFNEQLVLLAECCDVPELVDLKCDLSAVSDEVDKYNAYLAPTVSYINECEDLEKREKSLRIFGEFFTPLQTVDSYDFSEENIAAAKAQLKKFPLFLSGEIKTFEFMSNLYDCLLYGEIRE